MMLISSEMIFYMGLSMVGLAVLATAVAVPAFFLIGSQLRKSLEASYGKQSHSKKQ